MRLVPPIFYTLGLSSNDVTVRMIFLGSKLFYISKANNLVMSFMEEPNENNH